MELIFQVLHQGLEWIARSPQPKLVLDVLLIKCATAEALVYINSTPQGTGNATHQPQKNLKSTPASKSSPPGSNATGNTLRPLEITHTAIKEEAPNQRVTQSSTPDKKTWLGFIDLVRRSRPLLASILEHANGTKIPLPDSSGNDKSLVIYFSPNEAYFREQLQSRVYQEKQLVHFCKEYLGNGTRLQIEIKDAGESLVAQKEREQKREYNLLVKKLPKTILSF